MTTMTPEPGSVTGGVDTHVDVHVAAVVNHLGRVLGTRSFPTTAAGYRRLLRWMRTFGVLLAVGVEGTGSYGSALARHLSENEVRVIEVSRPNRQVRRRHGKTDVIDAAAAARAVLAAFRVRAEDDRLGAVTRLALRELAQRIQLLDEQPARTKTRLARITTTVAPELMARKGVGRDTASAILVSGGDNPHRLRDERPFDALAGSNPVPAGSGKTTRHRLNRGGDRQLNAAIWRIAIVRLATDPDTRAYLDRRTAEGKTKTEAIRCITRYIAREVVAALPQTAAS